ncbi:MAG: hypothetical protein RML36_07875 [Anaerolineae bacterium]|nr:hypothetical protein [Anaerolineae bacterium]MDW8099381.1 hypothetical protein [Anaerolineae bacterium]
MDTAPSKPGQAARCAPTPRGEGHLRGDPHSAHAQLGRYVLNSRHHAYLEEGFRNEDAAWRQERIFFDEAIWLPQKPDCPENGFPTCPDCGGTGDLHNAIGAFADTRPMRRQYSLPLSAKEC